MSSIKNIRKRLQDFIKVKSVDSILTHLKQIFLFKNQDKVCGSVNGSKIKIWICSNRVIGVFYPVIQLKLNETSNKIVIKPKMNRIGLSLAVLINAVIFWASLDMFFLRDGLTANSILQRAIVFVVFIGIFNFPIYMSYKVALYVLLKEVEDRIQVEKPLTPI